MSESEPVAPQQWILEAAKELRVKGLIYLGRDSSDEAERIIAKHAPKPVEQASVSPTIESRFCEAFDLIESAFAHVSHGGPTRAEAEKWLADNRSLRTRLK